MDYSEMIKRMDANVYSRFKTAIETGKWPDGRPLTQSQKETTLQAIIAWEMAHDVPETERTGYVDTGKSACHSDTGNPQETPLKWLH